MSKKDMRAGFANFFNEAKSVLKRISGIARGIHISDRVEAMEVSLIRKLNIKPIK